MRAFEYFAIFRAFYSRLIDDYLLLSVLTLSCITPKVSSSTDLQFLTRVLNIVLEFQRKYDLMWDEGYAKSFIPIRRN